MNVVKRLSRSPCTMLRGKTPCILPVLTALTHWAKVEFPERKLDERVKSSIPAHIHDS